MNTNNSLLKTSFFLLLLLLFLSNNIVAQEKLTLQNFNAIPSNCMINSIQEEGNKLYISTNKGLYVLNIESNEIEDIQKGKSIQNICFLNNKEYILANNNKIISKDGKILHKLETNIRIYGIQVFQKRLWLNTSDGIYELTNNNKYTVVNHFTSENSKLTSNDIKIMHKDKTNKMWIGLNPGLITIRKTRWKKDKDFKKHNVIGITENKDGIWALTDKDLIFTNYDGRGSEIGLENGLKRGKVTNVTSNSKGKLYIASNMLIGLEPYSDQSNDLGNEIELLSKQVTTSLFDKKDQLWIGTKQSGLFLLTIEKIKQAKKSKKKNKFQKQEAPPLTTILLVKNDITCTQGNNGALEVQATGGRSPYRFKWSTGSYENIIRDLAAGEYTVTVTDSDQKEATALFKFEAPQEITINILNKLPVSNKNTSDGSIIIDIEGGVPDYTIEWDGRKGKTKNEKLSIGAHSVKVTDYNGCVGKLDFDIVSPKILSELSMQKLEIGQTLPIDQLFFDADSTNVKEESFPVLEEIYEFLVTYPSVNVEIGGHTNNIPTHEYCNKLSTNRAKHIADYLVSKGLKEDRILYKGYGKTAPISSNKTAAGRKRNQRVELKILSI